jgi:hypothetical protein
MIRCKLGQKKLHLFITVQGGKNGSECLRNGARSLGSTAPPVLGHTVPAPAPSRTFTEAYLASFSQNETVLNIILRSFSDFSTVKNTYTISSFYKVDTAVGVNCFKEFLIRLPLSV